MTKISIHLTKRRNHLVPILLIPLLLFTTAFIASTAASKNQTENTVTAPAWMEPRGLSIIDAIGQVPESHLQDLVLAFHARHGILQYESGSRSGSTVTMRVKQTLLDPNEILCPSMAGRFDEWPGALPTATMRVFSSGQDVTARLESSYTYTPADLVQPDTHSGKVRRYTSTQTGTTQFDGSGAALVPANMECNFHVSGADLSNVVVEYNFDSPPRVLITFKGQESKSMFSWIGPEGTQAGILTNLNAQLWDRFGHELNPWGRTDGIPTDPSIYDDGDYYLVSAPPMPVNAYIQENVGLSRQIPGGGSQRIRASDNLNFAVSTDNTGAVLRPMFGTWKDADLTPGSQFLSHFVDFDVALMPEYILPPGVNYQSCMTNGGCSAATLDAVYDARYTMTIYYYKVERLDSSLQRIPLKLVGKGWQGRDTDSIEAITIGAQRIYLPLVIKPLAPLPEETDASCPCGWFDEIGRMYDFVLPP